MISLELPHWTSLQVFLACIPDKTFVFSVTIMQSSFASYSHIFIFNFSSLYSFSKQTLFLQPRCALVEIFPSAFLADGCSSAALPYDFFGHQSLLNLLATSLWLDCSKYWWWSYSFLLPSPITIFLKENLAWILKLQTENVLSSRAGRNASPLS